MVMEVRILPKCPSTLLKSLEKPNPIDIIFLFKIERRNLQIYKQEKSVCVYVCVRGLYISSFIPIYRTEKNRRSQNVCKNKTVELFHTKFA